MRKLDEKFNPGIYIYSLALTSELYFSRTLCQYYRFFKQINKKTYKIYVSLRFSSSLDFNLLDEIAVKINTMATPVVAKMNASSSGSSAQGRRERT